VHRIGRTGRAGASGIAMSFCDAEEMDDLKAIQKLIGIKIPVVEAHPYMAEDSGLVQINAPKNKAIVQRPNAVPAFNTRHKKKPAAQFKKW